MGEDGGLNLMYWINTFLDPSICMHACSCVRGGADIEIELHILRLDKSSKQL